MLKPISRFGRKNKGVTFCSFNWKILQLLHHQLNSNHVFNKKKLHYLILKRRDVLIIYNQFSSATILISLTTISLLLINCIRWLVLIQCMKLKRCFVETSSFVGLYIWNGGWKIVMEQSVEGSHTAWRVVHSNVNMYERTCKDITRRTLWN